MDHHDADLELAQPRDVEDEAVEHRSVIEEFATHLDHKGGALAPPDMG